MTYEAHEITEGRWVVMRHCHVYKNYSIQSRDGIFNSAKSAAEAFADCAYPRYFHTPKGAIEWVRQTNGYGFIPVIIKPLTPRKAA